MYDQQRIHSVPALTLMDSHHQGLRLSVETHHVFDVKSERNSWRPGKGQAGSSRPAMWSTPCYWVRGCPYIM